MRSVGVRELREKTTQILKEVSDKGESVQVTHHGRVMAHLVPPPKAISVLEDERARWIEQSHQLMAEIAEHVIEPTDASTLMQEERRW